MPTALFICDPKWSTGNIAKSLAATLPNWTIELRDWSLPFDDGVPHDAVVVMSMTGAARNPHWRTPRIAHVLAGPGEMDLPEVKALRLPENVVLAGVSKECADLLRREYPQCNRFVTPGFAHPTFFKFRSRPRQPVRRAGFVGFSITQNMQVSGSVKRPEMFTEICKAADVEPVFSEQHYAYEEMQKFYDSVDVVISTSSREGGPFAPIEAIACGVPALSTDVGIIHDMKLPGRFNTVEEAVALVHVAHALVPAQLAITGQHTLRAALAWDNFLHHAAAVRAKH